MAVSRKLRKYRGWIAAGALLLLAATAFYLFSQSKTVEPTTTYTTEPAESGILSVTVSGTGNLAIDGATEVHPRVSGTVASVAVAEGDQVTTGTVLFSLDADAAEATTARALASYRQAQASATQAQASLLRAENTLDDLEERHADQTTAASATTARAVDQTATTPAATTEEVTQSDIDAAEADVASAEANLNSATVSQSSALSDYEDAQDAEDDLAVTAPCSGTVYSLAVEAGDSVSTGSDASSAADSSASGAALTAASSGTSSASSSSACVTLVPDQPLSVCLTVNEVDVPTLEVGQRADIEFDALPDITSTGKVYEVASEGSSDQGVVTFDVWISIDVADDALRPGMSAAATIVTQIAKDALLVPNGAVKSDGNGGYYVEVLGSDTGTPAQVSVETGLSNATQTQILSGLSEGDLVVTATTTTDSSSQADAEEGGFGGGPGGGGGMMMPMGGPE